MLSIRHLSHAYDRLPVLDQISCTVQEGEIVSLIGPSGCGKSTLFHILTGLVKRQEGEIWLHRQPIQKRSRSFAYMPQNDSLFPWRTVLDNAILPQLIQGEGKKQAQKEALSWLPTFGLEGRQHAYPSMLSGGMRQRVNLLRTYLYDRPILLLDEPFASLDAITRIQMQDWLLQIWSQKKKTILLITHDMEEAIYLSDRIVTLSHRPAQVISSHEVDLPRPRSREMLTMKQYAQLQQQLLQELQIQVK